MKFGECINKALIFLGSF